MPVLPSRPIPPQNPGSRIFHLKLDPHLRATQPPMIELAKLWYLRRGPDGLPSRSAFDAQALKAFLPHIVISEYEVATRRYRYRLIGTAITDHFRRNDTGCYFDEIYGAPDLHDLRDIHDAVRLAGEPKTISGKITLSDRAAAKIEALLLPVGVPDGQNPQIVGALYFSACDAALADKTLAAAAWPAA